MDKPDEANKMNRTSTVGKRIAGSVVGLLAGGVIGGGAGGLIGILLASKDTSGDSDYALFWFIASIGLGLQAGTIIGAASGATIAQKLLGQRSSFWRALLGTFVGLIIGGFVSIPVSYGLVALGALVGYGAIYFGAPVITCSSMVAGAVIGSGWKAEPASSASGMTRPQQGVISPGDTLKQHSQVVKCPFCASTTFRVVVDADLRRCSDCHSILPNYIQGNP